MTLGRTRNRMESAELHVRPACPPAGLGATEESLQRSLWEQLRRPEVRSHRGLLSLTLPLPDLPRIGLPDLGLPLFCLASPEARRWRLGAGLAHQVAFSGAHRLFSLEVAFHELKQNWLRLDPGATGFEPGAFVGFAFDADDPMQGAWEILPNAGLFVPEVLLSRHDDRCAITFTAIVRNGRLAISPDVWWQRASKLLQGLHDARHPTVPRMGLARHAETPSADAWLKYVSQALAALNAKGISKLVPARSIHVQGQRRFNADRLLGNLSQLYPGCHLLGFVRNGRALLAASPEYLIQRRGWHVVCDAVGGSAARAAGQTADEAMGLALQNDSKARHEHDLVVTGITEALSPLAESVHVPATPALKRLRTVQHLWTRIEAVVAPSTSLLELARRLHPTPAVCGCPRQEAHRWLAENEGLVRGWYCGAAGWLAVGGDGELAVVLRCALVEGSSADLYAGAGIVIGSDPQAELVETELKLAAMLEALAAAGEDSPAAGGSRAFSPPVFATQPPP
jgi:isochorismate synthase